MKRSFFFPNSSQLISFYALKLWNDLGVFYRERFKEPTLPTIIEDYGNRINILKVRNSEFTEKVYNVFCLNKAQIFYSYVCEYYIFYYVYRIGIIRCELQF